MKPARRNRGWWLAGPALWVSVLLIVPAALAQDIPPALAPLVQPRPGLRPLGEVLAELSRQSHLPFSYSSSLVPTGRRCALRPGPPRPLAAVLREILRSEQLSFGLVDGQLVLWPDRLGIPAGVVAVNGRPASVNLVNNRSPETRALAKSGPTATSATSATSAAAITESNSRTNADNIRVKPAAAVARLGTSKRDVINQISVGKTSGKIKGAVPTVGRRPVVSSQSVPKTASIAGNAAEASVSRGAAATKKRAGRVEKAVSAATNSTALLTLTEPQATVRQSHQRISQSTKTSFTKRPGALANGGAPARLEASPIAALVAANRPKSPATLPSRSSGQRVAASASPAAVSSSAKQTTLAPAEAARQEVPLLAPATVRPAASALAGSVPLALPNNQVLAAAPEAQTATSTDSPPKQRTSLATLAGDKYLHGEAALGETLVLSGLAKAGFQRAYLVLGAGATGGGRQGGGGFGFGVGTAGQARGRFTPSLEVMCWFLNGEREAVADHSRLVQLRPALAWQIKQGRRWAFIGGPTFNLATTHSEGIAADRWPLGHDQWLWLDSADEHGGVRLWPGVQLGVRF